MRPYRPRPVRFHGLREHRGWLLKRYSIVHDAAPPEHEGFEPGVALALEALPAPAATPERPGTGFLIAHQGRNAWYLVLGWWDRENELPLRVWIRDEPGAPWRAAEGSESFCVWDLQVLWFEREAYVATLLAGDHPDPLGAYLGRHLSLAAPPGD